SGRPWPRASGVGPPPRLPVRRHRPRLAGLRALGAVSPEALSRHRQDRGRVRAPAPERRARDPRAQHHRPPGGRLRHRWRARRCSRTGDGPLTPRRRAAAADRERRQSRPRPRLRAALRHLVRARQSARCAPRRLRRRVSGGGEHVDRREDRQGDLDPCRAVARRRRAPALSRRRAAGRAALCPHRPAPRPGPCVARADRRRDAHLGVARPRLADLRRPRVPGHGRHAGRHRRDWNSWPGAGEARVRAARALHGGALGHAGSMKGTLVSFGFAALVWEAFARSGIFPAVATPSLLAIGGALVAMIADGTLFLKVVLPGALPFVIAGLRQAFARAWIAVVGGEMIAATSWGLGWLIFDSKEFLNTDVMIATLVAIGVLGLVFERVVFQSLERRTVGRWGMVRMAGA